MSKSERRENPRIEVKWPIVLTIGKKRTAGETLNISVEGISFCSDHPVSLEENYHLSIQPPNYPQVEVFGKITWSDLYGIDKDKTYCMGLCFIEISKEDRHFIEEVISDHL